VKIRKKGDIGAIAELSRVLNNPTAPVNAEMCIFMQQNQQVIIMVRYYL